MKLCQTQPRRAVGFRAERPRLGLAGAPSLFQSPTSRLALTGACETPSAMIITDSRRSRASRPHKRPTPEGYPYGVAVLTWDFADRPRFARTHESAPAVHEPRPRTPAAPARLLLKERTCGCADRPGPGEAVTARRLDQFGATPCRMGASPAVARGQSASVDGCGQRRDRIWGSAGHFLPWLPLSGRLHARWSGRPNAKT